MGKTNITHMKARHPDAYAKYGEWIPQIVSEPDYVKLHNSDGSIEFVKEFKVNNEYVKVAVRMSSGDKYYARSIYVLNPTRVQRFVESGQLKNVKKH